MALLAPPIMATTAYVHALRLTSTRTRAADPAGGRPHAPVGNVASGREGVSPSGPALFGQDWACYSFLVQGRRSGWGLGSLPEVLGWEEPRPEPRSATRQYMKLDP